MTTRLNREGPSPGVASTTTAPRVTPPPARPFREVLGAGTSAVVSGAEQAVRSLPGGPILAAAFRPAPGAPTPVTAGQAPEGTSGTAQASTGGGIEQTLADNSDRTLYYLELQERIAAETQAYTTLSNVLKARHDTIKNAIGNIR